MSLYQHKTLGSILLIAGTSIGAGMLALPITTGHAGFGWSALLFVLCFGYMLTNLFLLLEVNLSTTKMNANIISLAEERLGVLAQLVAWLCFLLLLYAVSAAYLSAGGSLLSRALEPLIGTHMTSHQGTLIFMFVFGTMAFFGTTIIDYVNRVLMFGLITSFILLIIFVTPHVHVAHLRTGHPSILWAAVPVVVLSFTSHLILPSLRTYLKSDVKQLKKAILFGSMLPLVFYLVWQFLIIGVLPYKTLLAISSGPHPVAELTRALSVDVHLTWIAIVVGAFSFFALVTSFLGVVLSLSDFLADGFKIKKTIRGRLLLTVMTILPPLLFAWYFPSGFVIALSYAGVFVAMLYGVLPSLMAWKMRYRDHVTTPYQLPGGKPVLLVILLLSALVIYLQVAATFGWV